MSLFGCCSRPFPAIDPSRPIDRKAPQGGHLVGSQLTLAPYPPLSPSHGLSPWPLIPTQGFAIDPVQRDRRVACDQQPQLRSAVDSGERC